MIVSPNKPFIARCTVLCCLVFGAVQMNTTLSKLDLSGNAVDESGIQAIAEALQASSGLESLKIRYFPWALSFQIVSNTSRTEQLVQDQNL